MNKKITVLFAIMILIGMYVPLALGASTSTVTGSFTPSATLAISCNYTSAPMGTISLASGAWIHNTSGAYNLTNVGEVNCSVTIQSGNGSGHYNLTANSSLTGVTDKFAVNIHVAGTSHDILGGYTLSSDLGTAANENRTNFNMSVYLSTFTSQEGAEQTFYANMTAAALS